MYLVFYAYCLHPELIFPGSLIKLEKSLGSKPYSLIITLNKEQQKKKKNYSRNSVLVYFFFLFFVQ